MASTESRTPGIRPSYYVHELSDGTKVGFYAAGHGVPLVFFHGMGSSCMPYVDIFARLTCFGFMVVGIDAAGCGRTDPMDRSAAIDLKSHVDLLDQAIRELGIRKAVFVGHSWGGRMAAELAAADTDRAIAAVLLDAAVGGVFDDIALRNRQNGQPERQADGFLRTARRTANELIPPNPFDLWRTSRLAWPSVMGAWRTPSLMVDFSRALAAAPPSSTWIDRLRGAGVPVVSVHGDGDVAVPLSSALDIARRTNGTLVQVRDAGHSWMIPDPSTLLAIVYDLLRDGDLGLACRQAVEAAGLSSSASREEVGARLCTADAPILSVLSSSGRAGGWYTPKARRLFAMGKVA
jgi:pimeloyl-ACP methyl ester carboxylesterase